VGPIVAALLLHGLHLSLRSVFLWAAAPAGIVIILLVFFLQDLSPGATKSPTQEVPVKITQKAWNALGRPFHVYLITLFVFTLGSSTDAFLLMRLSKAGLSISFVALLWSLHHVVKMASTYGGGFLADRFRSRSLILTGWFLYAMVYVGFAWASSPKILVALFLIYGVYYGICEPAERVLVSSLAPAPLRGTAFGYFHGVEGFAALPASALFGVIWKFWGTSAAFMTGAVFAGMACLLLWGTRKTPPPVSVA
jgi:predicted MFS family arabinose efflux permease